MGLLSKAISSLGRVASDKIADKITDAIKGSSSGNANNSSTQNSFSTTSNYTSINSLTAPVAIPSVSTEDTTINIFGRKISFKTLSPTCYWNSQDSFGAAEIDTVFIYSPNGASLEDTDYFSNQKAKIIFETSQLSPSNLEGTKNTIKQWYKVDNVNIQKLDNSIFTYKITGESSSKYVEVLYMEYDSNFDGNSSKVCYDIMLNIEKNTLSQDELYIAKHEFDTIINTLKFVE